MINYSMIVAAVGFLVYLGLTAALLAQLWYQHVFYRDVEKQSDATRYLSVFYKTVFIIAIVMAVLSVGGIVYAAARSKTM